MVNGIAQADRPVPVLSDDGNSLELELLYKPRNQLAEWRNRLDPVLGDDVAVDSVSGMETWFTLTRHSVMVPPPKYKMAVVTTIGASPFVLVFIPFLIAVLDEVVLPIVVALISLFVMSITMTWGTMPLFS
jgi:hypothetical protein